MNKRLLILSAILGLIAIFFTVKPLISPTSIPWKTHLNSKYGHQLMYPPDWQMEEWDIEQAANLKSLPDGSIFHQGKFFGKTGHLEVLIWGNKSQTPLRTWLTWYRHEDLILSDLPKTENFTIAGSPAIRYLQKKTSRKKPILYIFFNRDGKIFELTQEREDLAKTEATLSSELVNPVYDQIIQSFRFLTPPPTARSESPR